MCVRRMGGAFVNREQLSVAGSRRGDEGGWMDGWMKRRYDEQRRAEREESKLWEAHANGDKQTLP